MRLVRFSCCLEINLGGILIPFTLPFLFEYKLLIILARQVLSIARFQLSNKYTHTHSSYQQQKHPPGLIVLETS